MTYSGAWGGGGGGGGGGGDGDVLWGRGWVTCSRCNVLVGRYRRNDRNAIRESETFSV